MNGILVIMKNGFRYEGKLISENETDLVIDDRKLGRICLAKDRIEMRTGVEP